MSLIAKVKGVAKGIAVTVKGMTRGQIIIAGLATATVVGGIGTGSYLTYQHFHEPQEVVEMMTETQEDTAEKATETEANLVTAGESVTEATETEMETETETETEEIQTIKMVGSSMEKDLKIKIQNEAGKNVKNQPFEIKVKPLDTKAKASEYNDHDQDGIIYISEIEAGDYEVTLAEIEGFIIEEDTIKVTVKDQLEYEEVDVADEILDESQVSPTEDAEVVDNVKVESVIKDTIALVESTCTPQSVTADQIDTTGFVTNASTAGSVLVELKQELPAATASEIANVTTVDVETTESALSESTEIPSSESTETPSSESTEIPSSESTETPEQTPKEINYKITHVETGTGATLGTQSDTVDEGTVITFSFIGMENYTTTQGSSTTITANNCEITVEWTKKVIAETATVSIPQTATVGASGADAVTTITLPVAVSGTTSVVKSIDWASSDASVVTVSNGSVNGCTIKGVKNGTANVTATITYYGYAGNTTDVKTTQLSCSVTVATYTIDAATLLKDKSGNQLYTDTACTKAATVADYKAGGTYYTNPKYTGWQTLDGKVYYFDANGNKVTGTQVISGVTYNFGSDGALTKGDGKTGIDVSKWQGKIDWPTVAAAGIDFAIIRVGYRGSSTGALIEDPYFKANIKGATDAGIKVGVYFFTQAINEVEAVEEASMVLNLVSGYNLSYPIFIDTENGSGNARANGLDKATRTKCIAAFCKTIQNSGKTAGIYASKSWYNNKLDMSQLNQYCIWVAQYNTTCTYSGKYSIWQYTSKGSVPGIKGNVDINKSYM